MAVDEAHCVSGWGHDFRPDYLRLGEAIERLGRPPVVALTATASPPVRDDIVSRLGMRDPLVLVHGLDRPEIALEVVHQPTEAARREAVVLRTAAEAKPALLYTRTRAAAEDYARQPTSG